MTRSVSIFDTHQKESAGGGGGCGGGSVAQVKNAPDIGDSEAAFSDHKECPDKVAHHVVEKSVAAHSVDQFIAATLPL